MVDQLELNAELNNKQTLVCLFVPSMLLSILTTFLHLLQLVLFQCIYHRVLSITSMHAYLSATLLTCRSASSPQQLGAYPSLRVPDSVPLSSNTCCRRSASLLSDDAQSSPPSFLSFHATLPVSLSLTHTHVLYCMFFF